MQFANFIILLKTIFSLDNLSIIITPICSLIITIYTLYKNHLVSIDNNRIQLKIKELEFEQKYKLEKRNNALEAAKNLLKYASMITESKESYKKYYSEYSYHANIMRLYLPKSSCIDLFEEILKIMIDDTKNPNHFDDAKFQLQVLTNGLSEIINGKSL